MAERNADIIIHGGGIAGLWTLARLKNLGYDTLLVEPNAIGGVQTIASQGIIHSGLKYALGGKLNSLAREISAMPEIWRAALNGEGPVDLSKAQVATETQYLMIPKGMLSGIMKLGAKSFLGSEVEKIKWPPEISASGFEGTLVDMSEPVLDIPSVVRALAEPYMDCIRKSADGVAAKKYIYTAAEGNDESGIATQRRPLLMGLLKNAPFAVWAHFVGASDKPVATITTHKTEDGGLAWYIGGQVAERERNSNPDEVYDAIFAALKKYMPMAEIKDAELAVLPIDRVEAKPGAGVMPDAPVIYNKDDRIYAWPTKLTFAPMMADKIAEELTADKILPSHNHTDWSFLPEVSYAQPPWETAQWIKDKSDKRA
ncbi:MAG: FAD-dependent oxidoreductase [Alphaproteobacteria bacterium]